MIRGQKRALDKQPNLNVNLNASIHNRFDIEVVDAKTGEVKQRAQAQNIICDSLWTRLLTPAAYFSYIHYGTGSGTPSTSDTKLFTFLGYQEASNATYGYDFENGVVSLRKSIQLSETTAVGSTLTEVGIAYSTSTSSLVTHAMLKDMNGNQISILKSDTDIINIYATVFVHYNPSGYDNGKIKIFANTSNPLLKTYLVGNGTANAINRFAATVGGVADMPRNNTDLYAYGSVKTTYDVSSKKITIQAERMPVGSFNLTGGVGCIILGYDATNISGGASPTTYYFVCGVLSILVGASWYNGTEVVGEAVATGDGVSVDFATKFPLVSNATIYVDGVASDGVRVDGGLPISANAMGRYFELIPEKSSALASIPDVYSNSYEDTTGVYYNPFYMYGIVSYSSSSYLTVSVSDDLETWVVLSTSGGTISVPPEYQNYKYWKIDQSSRGHYYIYNLTSNNIPTTNIHFSSPPTEGAVITADYFTKTIAKDENHVFDLTVTLQLGEYTE